MGGKTGSSICLTATASDPATVDLNFQGTEYLLLHMVPFFSGEI